MQIWVVINSIDIYKTQTLELIAAAQEVDLPHTQRTSTVKQQSERGIGLLSQGIAKIQTPAWRICSANGDLLRAMRRMLDAWSDTPKPENAISNAGGHGMGGDKDHHCFSNDVDTANCALKQGNWLFCSTTNDETNTHKMR